MKDIIKFGQHSIEFIEENGEKRANFAHLCRALGYKDPKNAEKVLFGRFKAPLEELGVICQLDIKPSKGSVGGRPSFTRYLNMDQCNFIIIRSDADNSIPLQQFIAKAFTKYLKGEVYQGKPLDTLDVLELTIKKLREQDQRISTFENRLDESYPITPGHRIKISNLIQKYGEKIAEQEHKEIGNAVQLAYARFCAQFNIDKYLDLPERLFYSAKTWLIQQTKKLQLINRYLQDGALPSPS